MQGTLTRPTNLTETSNSHGRKLDIDREKGIIRGVKVLGSKSVNGRTYTESAMRKAVPLYEGAKVNVNHKRGEKPGPRDYEDRFGRIKNVRYEEGALYGDLHFNPHHALAEQVLWDAEHEPENLGLSHNVDGLTTKKAGQIIVEEIVAVHSVDLVADPATNKGLFESKDETMSRTVKQILEAVAPETFGHSILTQLIEDEMLPGDMAVDAPATASAGDQIKSAFRSMVMAAFDDEKLDTAATLAKIKEILKAQEKLMGTSSTPEKKEPPKEETATESTAKVGELQEQVRRLTVENEVRALVESAGVTADAITIKAACALPEAVDRKKFIEGLPKRSQQQTSGGKPRSTAPLTEGKGEKSELPKFEKSADRAKFLRGK